MGLFSASRQAPSRSSRALLVVAIVLGLGLTVALGRFVTETRLLMIESLAPPETPIAVPEPPALRRLPER